MAQIYPDIKTINMLKVRPTPGEATLLNFLKNNLSDDFEIYFQPWINMDHPDIIIMKKDSGVMIIEVKDWNLNNYKLDNNKNWIFKNKVYKSPLDQVKEYKDNIYNLHIDNLLEYKINNKNYYSIVNCAIYFHNATNKKINSFLTKGFENDTKYIKELSYFDIIGSDDLDPNNFLNILNKRKLTQKSNLFKKDIYDSFKRYFQPTQNTIDQGKKIFLSKKQKELSVSTAIQQKIKGVAGSGKTQILALRAVNAYQRTKSKVLILTYNITLRNYIHDKISDERKESDWGNFHIIHYHQFITAQTNNLNIKIRPFKEGDKNTDYDNELLFDGHEHEIEKYDSIFIDEIQDFKTQWIKIIKKYFLADNGELVVFGDEKQNIYNRSLDNEKKPVTTIPGAWNILNESFRIENEKVSELSSKFKEYYFKDKYEKDTIQFIKQEGLPFNDEILHLYFTNNKSVEEIANKMLTIIKNKNIHPNDICFISSKIETIRAIDFEIRKQSKEKTKTTFISQEDIKKLDDKNSRYLERSKKFHFWLNPGFAKLSTIASFKGWEIPELFLIIDENEDNDNGQEELFYTAITRCRHNLRIINLNNKKYYDFLIKNPDLVSTKIF